MEDISAAIRIHDIDAKRRLMVDASWIVLGEIPGAFTAAGDDHRGAAMTPEAAGSGARVVHPCPRARIVQRHDQVIAEIGKLFKERMPSSFDVCNDGNPRFMNNVRGADHTFHTGLVHEEDLAES